MNNTNQIFKNILSIVSFLLAFLMTVIWFLLIYWKFPAYTKATKIYLSYGVTGFSWLFESILYFLAFSPLLIAIVILLFEYTFLKRKNKILKVCFSLIVIFGTSMVLIPFIAIQSNSYISNFNTNIWEKAPQLRYESVDDLLSKYKIIGMDSNELFSLLGPQDYENKGNISTDYFWNLKNPLSMNNKYLKITISNGTVISDSIN